MIIVGAILIAVVGTAAVAGVVAKTTPAAKAVTRADLLRQHYILTRRAARAYRKGRDGEANINAEAADRIMKLLDEDPE